MSDSDDGLGLNDLGVPALAHWEMYRCSLSAPGDWAMDEVSEVTCPECLKKLDELRQRHIAARRRA